MTNEEMNALRDMDVYYNRMGECISTSGRRNNYDKMVALFKKFECVRKVWRWLSEKYYLVDRFVKRVIKNIGKKIEECQDFSHRGNWFYLIHFFNKKHELVYSKIGETIRPVSRRAWEETQYYKDVQYSEIIAAWDCGKTSCKTVEDKVKDYLNSNGYLQYYKPKDRYTCRIGFNELTNIVASFC